MMILLMKMIMTVNHSTILTKYDYVGNMEDDYLIRILNQCMSGICQSIELIYGAFFNLFSLFESKWPFIMLNCYTCLNGSACNSIFDSFSLTIKESSPLDEDLVPFLEEDDLVHNFYFLNKKINWFIFILYSNISLIGVRWIIYLFLY